MSGIPLNARAGATRHTTWAASPREAEAEVEAELIAACKDTQADATAKLQSSLR